MLLTFNAKRRRYELVSHFEERQIAKDARFQWDAETKRWFTENHKTAVKLIRYADESTKAQLTYLLTN